MPQPFVRVAIAALMSCACSGETSVFVVVDAQDLGRLRGASLQVRAFGPDGEVEPSVARWSLEDGGAFPLVVRVTPSGGDVTRRWALSALLERADGSALVQNRIVGGFVAGERRYALLCLEDTCFDAACAGPAACDPARDGDPGCSGCVDGACGRLEAELLADRQDLRCPPRPPPPESFCGDGIDDDADSLVDCEDEDCEGRPCSAAGRACLLGRCVCPRAASETSCSGGVDEDCDTRIDCADDDCTDLACDDGNACTTGDRCAVTGECVGTALDCDDGVACTIDACDDELGCTHRADAALCNDDEACTTDVCDLALGCMNPPVGGACSDGNPCTVNDACAGGRCAGQPRDCDDGNPCTIDTCVVSGSTSTCNRVTAPTRTRCGTDRVCCGQTCTHMGNENNCGGCGHSCRGTRRCFRESNDRITSFTCNCGGGDGCPNGQDCRTPSGESASRCMCDQGSHCQSGDCVARPGQYNLCRWY